MPPTKSVLLGDAVTEGEICCFLEIYRFSWIIHHGQAAPLKAGVTNKAEEMGANVGPA